MKNRKFYIHLSNKRNNRSSNELSSQRAIQLSSYQANLAIKLTSYQTNKLSGIATLPTIMALTILILAVGIGITSLAFSESLISAGATQSSKALVYAEAGARDALQRIARDKKYNGSYTIDFVTNGCSSNDGCATVTVSTGTGATGNPKIITSNGRVKGNIRKIQVDVLFDEPALNGKITSTAWSELTN